MKALSGRKAKNSKITEEMIWEKEIIDEKLWSTTMFSRLALLQLNSGDVRAKAPADFTPDKNGWW